MCNSNTKFDFSSIMPVFGDSFYLSPHAINMHISMPCPLKVPFNQFFTPYVKEYNASHATPIYCPNIMDCSSEDIEWMLRTAKSESDLPDIIVTSNYRILFSGAFYDTFMKTGRYKGLIRDDYKRKMPADLAGNLERSNLGILCFSSWSFVRDLTVEGVPTDIESWEQIISPDRKGEITVHGHIDKATFGLAYFIVKHWGKEGLVRFAQNITDIKHFSNIIKRMGSGDPEKTALNLLPDVAASKIPSSKKIKKLNLKEGKVLAPMVLMVKASKIEACSEILEKIGSRGFSDLLKNGGCIMPDTLDPEITYFIPDFWEIADRYEEVEQELNKIYLGNLPKKEIEGKIKVGSLCK